MASAPGDAVAETPPARPPSAAWPARARLWLWALTTAGILLPLMMVAPIAHLYGTKLLMFVVPWMAVPLAAAAWLSTRIVPPGRATVVIAGVAVVAGVSCWLYWDALYGPTSRRESLSGLIVLMLPAYQIAGLLPILLLARWTAACRRSMPRAVAGDAK